MAERKWMYVLRGEGESHAAWSDQMKQVAREALGLGPSKLQLTVTEAPPPKVNLFPFKSQPIAIFNVYDGVDAPSRFTNLLRGAASSVSGYLVEEAYPVAYEKTWSDGEPTPSPILLTMLRKKASVSTDEFIDRWHNGHTPLSLQIHPLWYYQRNVIVEPITEWADPSDGIVLEACRTRGDLLNPARFFGGALKMVPNMLRVAMDINGFLDMKKTETFYATEYHLRS
jgi:hypothetical protein